MTLRLLLASLILACQAASAEVLFEAFYRIEKDNKHLGYVVQRLSQTPTNKTLVTYIQTVVEGDKFYETFKSVAKNGTWSPIESVHGGTNTGSHSTLAAYFKADKAWVETRHSNSRKALSKDSLDVKKTPFLSSFIFYAADLDKLQKGKNYAFDFYAERVGRAAYGQMSLEGERNGVKHIVLDILGEPQENFVNANGDALGARSPAQGTIVYWVKAKGDAVGQMEYPSRDLIALFGDLPEGKKNPWSSLSGFDAKNIVTGFQKSFGTRTLATKEREKITIPLPVRKGKS